MKKYSWILITLVITAIVLSSCVPPPYTAPEGTPHNECSKVCKEIYDVYWPDAPIGACVSQCQTGKYTAFKSTCNDQDFLEYFEFETKKECLNYWDSLK